MVADCRKVVTGTPSNDTDPWGLNINDLSEHLWWKESSWRERKRGLGERNLSLSLPRHKLCCSTNVWERISCVRRKERAHKPLKGAWVGISSRSWGRTVSLYSVSCHCTVYRVTGGDQVPCHHWWGPNWIVLCPMAQISQLGWVRLAKSHVWQENCTKSVYTIHCIGTQFNRTKWF